jgi:hypothetical protein
VKHLILPVFAALALTACSDPEGARKALQAQGYRDIQITGYAYWGCGKDDVYHTGFTAVGPTGVPVIGVVCKGHFKGSTVRID